MLTPEEIAALSRRPVSVNPTAGANAIIRSAGIRSGLGSAAVGAANAGLAHTRGRANQEIQRDRLGLEQQRIDLDEQRMGQQAEAAAAQREQAALMAAQGMDQKLSGAIAARLKDSAAATNDQNVPVARALADEAAQIKLQRDEWRARVAAARSDPRVTGGSFRLPVSRHQTPVDGGAPVDASQAADTPPMMSQEAPLAPEDLEGPPLAEPLQGGAAFGIPDPQETLDARVQHAQGYETQIAEGNREGAIAELMQGGVGAKDAAAQVDKQMNAVANREQSNLNSIRAAGAQRAAAAAAGNVPLKESTRLAAQTRAMTAAKDLGNEYAIKDQRDTIQRTREVIKLLNSSNPTDQRRAIKEIVRAYDGKKPTNADVDFWFGKDSFIGEIKGALARNLGIGVGDEDSAWAAAGNLVDTAGFKGLPTPLKNQLIEAMENQLPWVEKQYEKSFQRHEERLSGYRERAERSRSAGDDVGASIFEIEAGEFDSIERARYGAGYVDQRRAAGRSGGGSKQQETQDLGSYMQQKYPNFLDMSPAEQANAVREAEQAINGG